MSSPAVRWLGGIPALVLPPTCIACHRALGPIPINVREPQSGLCADCRALLHPLDLSTACAHCGAVPARFVEGRTPPGKCEDCAELPDSFVEARSAFPYQSPAGLIVRNLKYHRASYLGAWLVALSLPVLESWFRESVGEAMVVPVPMTMLRQMKRGYNQAEEIARAVAEQVALPMAREGVLRRIRAAKPQARYASRSERLANIRDVYAVPEPRAIRGRRILLVDDVMTSGCTASQAARTLKEAGAGDIYIHTPIRARLATHEDADEAQ